MRFALPINTAAFTAGLLAATLLGGTTPVRGITITYIPTSGPSVSISDPACTTFGVNGTALVCNPVSNPGSPNAPTGCVATITTTPAGSNTVGPLTNAGGTANLSVAQCFGTGLTYSWSRNGSTPGWSTSQNPTDALGANSGQSGVQYSYQVKVCSDTGDCTGMLPAAGPLTATVPGSGVVIGGTNYCSAPEKGGFTKTMWYEWDWTNKSIFIQTSTDSQGPIGNNGIAVIHFVAKAAGTSNGTITLSEYPANSTNPLGIMRALSISESPCDFSGTSVQYGTKFGVNAGNTFTVAPASIRSIPKLTVGKDYYINITNRDSAGTKTCTGQCEMRIEANHPL